jgi:Xaa-Pro aminopeptidase
VLPWEGADQGHAQVLLGENASLAVAEAVGLSRAEVAPSLVSAAKAIKNDVEIDGFRQCHIRDGAALCAYFAWLEEQLSEGQTLNEAEGASQLEHYRSCVASPSH